jgi:hypothetical protein
VAAATFDTAWSELLHVWTTNRNIETCLAGASLRYCVIVAESAVLLHIS